MADHYWVTFFVVIFCFFKVFDASAGDADPLYRSCVSECEKTGCVGERCFPHCKYSSDGSSTDGPWYMQEPLYLRWEQWDCESDCRYHCMLHREKDRAALGQEPRKYHGKWPFKHLYGFQEPVSVALSAVNLAMHFHGWLSFFILLYYKLPLNSDKTPYYNHTGLWHIYGLLSMNSWLWSAVFHSREARLLICYSLAWIFADSVYTKNFQYNAARVMVAAPLLAFIATHILYINNYQMDYEWNMKVCVVMGVAQLLIWSIWAGVTRHPSHWKLWLVVVGGGPAMLLEIYDFPPYQGLVDAHALWHATTIPLTFSWWSFIKDDTEFQTSQILKKVK